MQTKRATPKRRPRHAMPADVGRALRQHRLGDAYRARPAYQRNDYLGWIARAVRDATRQKRIEQMLAELAAGEGYMNMAWHPRASVSPKAKARGKRAP